MKREELDKLISDYANASSDEKERVFNRVFRGVFGVCLDMMSRTVGEIKSSELEVDSYNKGLFDTFFRVYDICEGMTDIEIDSVDTGSYNVILKILPSGRLLSIDKDWLCDEYVKGRMKDFDFAKKQYDDAASKLLKAKTLDMRIEL